MFHEIIEVDIKHGNICPCTGCTIKMLLFLKGDPATISYFLCQTLCLYKTARNQ